MPQKKINDPQEAKVYAKVSFGYSTIYVLPYEEGIALMSHFREAEQLDSSSYDNLKIIPMDKGPELSIMSREEYTELKMKALLLEEPEETT